MRGPSTPRGWLSWAANVTAHYHRAHSARYDDDSHQDRRLNYARETAISIIRMVERSANGNGGAGLLYSFYVEDAAWSAFTEYEQWIISKTIRTFAKALRKEGFIPSRARDEG
jgi:hypothetical protein